MATIAELEAQLAAAKAAALAPATLRLDLGCGKNKKDGFTGVDAIAFPGVDVVCDLVKLVSVGDVAHHPVFDRWPWADSSVDEVHCSHVVEHFVPAERIHFVNELWRVLKPDVKATIITPHWTSCRAYGDLTHQWPPVTEFWWPYLQKAWRSQNAPHEDRYVCNFDCLQPGYSLHPALQVKAQDFRDFAVSWYKEAAQDMLATLVARK